MISKICLDIKSTRSTEIQELFDAACEKYGVTDELDKAQIAAQLAHESGEFTIKSENMNYSSPARIVEIWPSRFTLIDGGPKLNANNYTKNPQKLANEVYANRMGNGNQASGDGYKYRGAGFLQCTGKESYQGYAKYVGKTTEEVADLMRSSDEVAMDAGFWEYCINKRLIGKTDFVAITKAINGGVIGLGERRKYLARAIEA
jgi:putative chitinase